MRGRLVSVNSRKRSVFGFARSSAPRSNKRAYRNRIVLKPAAPSTNE